MARWHPKVCRDCTVTAADGHHISARGFCIDCSDRRIAEFQRQLRNKEGEQYAKWRRKMRRVLSL
jgi:hypothetical protein